MQTNTNAAPLHFVPQRTNLSDEEIRGLVRPTAVHRRVYTDPEIFALEMDRLWGTAWIYIGHESQVPKPGDFITTTLATRPVIMVRSKSTGEINVLHNRCSHRGAVLSWKPYGRVGSFRCPYHGWTFDTDGRIDGIPHECGYDAVGTPAADPEHGLRQIPRVQTYRGFVFASLAPTGTPLVEFLGELAKSIDNLVDRSPEGAIEVSSMVCHQFDHPTNWKTFVENLVDAMHPMVAHAGTGAATNAYVRETLGARAPRSDWPPELEVIDPFMGPYEWFDDMGVTSLPHGHVYAGGKKNMYTGYKVNEAYLSAMIQARGEERTQEILGFQRHNATIYPSVTVRDPIQSLRVVRPLAVDRTIVESWVFRLKGAPDEMLERSLLYSRLINSPASMVGPDDLEAYARMQSGLESNLSDWVDQSRYHGEDVPGPGGSYAAKGTSDMAMRRQYQVWLAYMTHAEMPK